MPIQRIWQIRLPSYANGSTQVSADGRILYLLGTGELYCVLPNRHVAWKRRVAARSMGGLFVEGQRAYVAGPTLLRIDVESGQVIARRDVVDELPWLWLGRDGLTLHQSATGTLSALDLDTLGTLWETPNPEASMVVHEGLLCCGTEDGDVRLVDPITRELRSRLTLPRAVGIPQHLHYQRLYCRFCGPERLAVNVDRGETAWRRFEGSRGRQVEFVGGSAFSVSPSSLHTVYAQAEGRAYAGNDALSAFDLLTGNLVWRQSIGRITTVSLLHEGRMAVATSDGVIYVVRSSNGAVVGTHELRRQIWSIKPAGATRLVVETFSSDQNSSELHLLEVVEDAADTGGAPAHTTESDPQGFASQLVAAWPPRAADVLHELEKTNGPAYLSAGLGHSDAHVRRHAARRLGEARDEPSVGALIATLAGEADEWVRREIAMALARIGSDESVKGLTAAFERAIASSNGESRSVRDYADALALAKNAVLVPLVAALATRRFGVAEWAAAALGRLRDPAAIDALIQVLDEPRGLLPLHAREALLLIGAPAVPALISALTTARAQVQENAAIVLGRMRAADALDPLLRAAGTRDVGVKAAAAEALGRISDTSSVPTLIGLLKDRNWMVRKNAAEALAAIRDASSVDALLAASADPDDDVRAAVAEALLVLADRRTIPALSTMLAGRGPHAAAAVGLAAFGQECIPRLLPLLKERRFETRFWTITALGWLGERRAVPALAKVPASDEVIRDAVAVALQRLAERS